MRYFFKLMINVIMLVCLFLPWFKNKGHLLEVKLNEAGQMVPKVISKTFTTSAFEYMSTNDLNWLIILELVLLSLSIASSIFLLLKVNNRLVQHLNVAGFILSAIVFVIIMYLSYTNQAHY